MRAAPRARLGSEGLTGTYTIFTGSSSLYLAFFEGFVLTDQQNLLSYAKATFDIM